MKKKNKTKKYVAIFVLKEQGTFTKLAEKKFKATNTSVRYRKRTFIIDTSFATYSIGLKQFFFIDLLNGQTYLEKDSKKTKKLSQEEKARQLKLKQLTIDPEIADMLISRKIIAQLTTNLSDTAMKINIMTLLIGGVVGALIGYMIAGM